MAWAKIDSVTLGSALDTIDTAVFISKTFIHGLSHLINTGGIKVNLRMGKTTIDTGADYADRKSIDGAVDATDLTATAINFINTDTADNFIVFYMINISASEKLLIGFRIDNWAAGAGTAPARTELVAKWVNTTNQADILESLNTGVGSFDTGSNLTAMGTD